MFAPLISTLLLSVLTESSLNQGGQSQPDEILNTKPTWPNEPIQPFGMEKVSVGGQTFILTPDGSIGSRLVGGGRWSDVINGADTKSEIKVKVVFVNDSSVLVRKGENWISERSFLWGDRIDAAKQGMAMLGAYSAASMGVKMSVTYVQDTDPYYFENQSPNEINEWLISRLFDSKTNAKKFDSQDPTDFGPYDLTLILHSAWTKSVSISKGAKGTVLATSLYTAPRDIESFVANAGLTAWLLSEKNSRTVWLERKPNGTQVVRSLPGADGVISGSPVKERFTKVEGVSEWTFAGSARTAVELLELDPEVIENPLPAVATGFGDFSATTTDGIITAKRLKRAPTGGVVVAAAESGAMGSLTVRGQIRSNAKAAYALRLVDSKGRALKVIQVSDSRQELPWDSVIHQQVEFDGEWKDFVAQVDVTEQVAQVQFGTLRGSLADRGLPDEEFFEFRNFEIVSTAGNGEKSAVVSYPADALTQEFEGVGPGLTGGQWGSLKDALTGSDRSVAIAALNILTRTQHLEATPLLVAIASSANEVEVPLAVQALAFQNTPESWAGLRSILEKGPFSVNRKAAWSVLKSVEKDESWSKTATLLSIEVPWEIRYIGLELSSQIASDQSGVIVLTSFQDVDPNVRQLAATKLDPNNELFARRLIFMGVNDSSEAVRVACLTQLLDSQLDRFRSEAHRGIRDESVAVRLELLAKVASRKNEVDRPMLQLAMTDSDPTVLAAALVAYAQQPGSVSPGEVQTAFKTDSVVVAHRLLQLSLIKKFEIPADTRQRFAKFEDSAINELLKNRGGNL